MRAAHVAATPAAASSSTCLHHPRTPSLATSRLRATRRQDVPHGPQCHPLAQHPSGGRPQTTALGSDRQAFAALASSLTLEQPGLHQEQITVVMKFGGSSVANAERMLEVASIVCSFPDQYPCVVLSAMGKTTNLLLQCGEEALVTPADSIPSLQPLRAVKELHRETADRLQVDNKARAEVEALLTQLQQLLVGISIMQDLTPRAKDSLVSFGERLSTRLFAALLNVMGVPSQQHDSFEIGFTSSDNFTNAEVNYEATLPALRASLTRARGEARRIPIVTGFLAKGESTGAVTTLGRGGSDLTATVIGAALELPEVQVWKDVDGVLTSDPRLVAGALTVPLLTFDEATELAFFGATVLHPLAMQPAVERGDMGVRVKNSYNRTAPGTLISSTRDLSGVLVTSIVLKTSVTLLDIASNRMVGQFGFLAKVFGIFERARVSVDVVATSEVSVSLTLDPSKMPWNREVVESELDGLVDDFKGIATVKYTRGVSIVSLICNVSRTSEILERVFRVLGRENINVKMMSQGASKTNISLIVDDSEGRTAVKSLHEEFFGAGSANGNVVLSSEE